MDKSIISIRRIVLNLGLFRSIETNPTRGLVSTAPMHYRVSGNIRSLSDNENRVKRPKSKGRIRNIAPISITERAANRIKEMIDGKENVVGIRLGVKRRGCNGYSYTMTYAHRYDIDLGNNEVVEEKGVTVLVDPKAIFFMVGTTMDYKETDLTAEFTFINPNVKGECGCGESFNV